MRKKKYKKNYEIPHTGSGPAKTKEILKKYENGPKMTVFVCLYFCFGAQPGGGDFVSFFFFFSQHFRFFFELGGFQLYTRIAESQFKSPSLDYP